MISKYLKSAEVYTALALAFFIPLWPEVLPLLIAIALVLSFANSNWVRMLKNKNQLKWFFLFASFYIIYLISIIYSPSQKSGTDELVRKLSLIIFPLAYIGSIAFEKKTYFRLFKFFVLGCLLACAYSFLKAGYLLWLEQTQLDSHIGINYFFTSRLSGIIHPTYFSIYLAFAVAILILYKNELKLKPLQTLVSILVLCITTVFINSKAAVISLYVVIALLIVVSFFTKQHFIYALSALGITLCTFLILFYGVPQYSGRYKAAVKAVETSEKNVQRNESSAERMVIWQAAIKVAKRNIFTGVGVGAQTDSLDAQYKADNASAAFDLQLNAHNNYLQALVTTGIFGLISLVAMLFVPALFSFIRKNRLYLIFIFLISFNLLFESMFQTQAGVVFYGFFNMILFKGMMREDNEAFLK